MSKAERLEELTQDKVEEACRLIRDRYLGLPYRTARETFAYELQGFVASEVERGATYAEAIEGLMVLIDLLNKANRR